nr:Zinc finger, RING-CH-type [Ipomoea batatas]
MGYRPKVNWSMTGDLIVGSRGPDLSNLFILRLIGLYIWAWKLESIIKALANRLKCNVDAAVIEDGAGYGAVVRDHTGILVFAGIFCENLNFFCGLVVWVSLKMQSLDKSGVDLEAGERGDGGRRNSAAVSGGRPCSSEVSGVPAEKRISSVSECSVEVDLEGAYAKEETKLHFLGTDRDCRICHLSMDSENQEPSGTGGVFIELGCSCKDDLAAAHKHCAEAWFKIKGNR